MVKVLIVDDEQIIINDLRSLIPWENEGLYIVGEASNGLAALKMVEELQPDIILLDIEMPVMDGLTFLKRLQEFRLKPKIIILSSHEDFSYARKAIELKVNNYLLKHTLESDVLLKTITEVVNELHQERQRENRVKTLEERLSTVLNVSKQAFFKELMDGWKSVREYEAEAKRLDIDLTLSDFHFFSFFVDGRHLLKANNRTEDWESVKILLIRLLQRILEKYNGGEMFIYGEDALHLLLNNLKISSELKLRNTLRGIADGIREEIREAGFDISFSVVIDPRVKNFFALKESLAKARETLKLRAFSNYGKVFLLGELNYSAKKCNAAEINKWLDIIKGAVELSDTTNLEKALTTIFTSIIKDSYDTAALDYVADRLIGILDGAVEKCGLDTDKLFPGGYEWMPDTVTDVLCYFTQRFRELVNEIKEINTYENAIIKKALSYMKLYYSEDISLQSVAEHVKVSYIYLSHLFKNVVGENFSSYLTVMRIDKAREMLLAGDMKLYEVARRVGFNDPKYFSIVFKKTTGVSPVDFKNSGR